MTLVIEGLTVVRGERTVLENVSASVAAGEALAVTGPNGAGKSTLLRAIAGLVPARGGSIRLEGEGEGPALHYVAHLNAIKPQLSVRDNAAFFARLLGPPTGTRTGAPTGAPDEETRVEEALESVGLLALAELPAATLSQGQRRRLALSRLLCAPRPLWLLDEPSAGLDAASAARLAALMTAHLGGGGIIVAATHEPLPVARVVPLALR